MRSTAFPPLTLLCVVCVKTEPDGKRMQGAESQRTGGISAEQRQLMGLCDLDSMRQKEQAHSMGARERENWEREEGETER